MAINLDTAFTYQPGHGLVQEILSEVKIIHFSIDIEAKVLTIRTQYGNHINDVWVAGNAPGHDHQIKNIPEIINYADPENSIPADPVYDTLMATSLTPAAGLPLYGVVGASLYQVLIDEGLYEGTIVL